MSVINPKVKGHQVTRQTFKPQNIKVTEELLAIELTDDRNRC